jgi:hydroxymethylglutaryl-CoA lyase
MRRDIPDLVTVTEVVLRDGLQDETRIVPTEAKLRLLDGLIDAGVSSVELGAFVRPERVPQMADTEELFSKVTRLRGACYSALVFNRRGAERALVAGVDEVRLVVSASEGHSRANGGRPVGEALDALREAVELLRQADPALVVVGSIAMAFDCPFDGPTSPKRLAYVADALASMGITRLQLADTMGSATPLQIRAGVAITREVAPDLPLGFHLHDTLGMGLACVWEALSLGVDRFDAALGGIGGCPFAPGAAGNLATEDLVGLLDASGIDSGIQLGSLTDLLGPLAEMVGHGVNSHRGRVSADPQMIEEVP